MGGLPREVRVPPQAPQLHLGMLMLAFPIGAWRPQFWFSGQHLDRAIYFSQLLKTTLLSETTVSQAQHTFVWIQQYEL